MHDGEEAEETWEDDHNNTDSCCYVDTNTEGKTLKTGQDKDKEKSNKKGKIIRKDKANKRETNGGSLLCCNLDRNAEDKVLTTGQTKDTIQKRQT